MRNNPVTRPVETVSDLVDYFLCEDNDSPGCSYVRGWVSFLKGAPLQPEQATSLLFFLRDDTEVYDLFLSVAKASRLLPTVTTMMVVNKLTRVYQKHAKDTGNHEP